MAVFRHFRAVSAAFLCQGLLFHFCEKTALATLPPTISKRSFRARIRAGGKRERETLARANSVRAQRDPFVFCTGVRRGRRETSASGGTNSSVEPTAAPVCGAARGSLGIDPHGLRRDLGARTFDGWLKPAELGVVRTRQRRARPRHAQPVHGRLGPLPFRRAAALAWKTVLPVVRDVRVIAAADAPRPAPLLILEEAPPPAERDPNAPNFDPRYRFETFVVGKANEVAATAARTLATSPTVGFNPLFIHGGTGPRQDPFAARDRPRFPGAQSRRARRLDVGREVHGRVHPRAERKRHDRVQAAPAERRPAADRRRPVHRRQGFDPGRILPHDERDHHRRAAAGDHLGPGAAGPRRDRAAHPVAPVVGPGRRHQRRRLRAPLQHHRREARGAARRRDAAPGDRLPRAPRDSARSASSKARSTASALMR